jgi:hypothetical protein
MLWFIAGGPVTSIVTGLMAALSVQFLAERTSGLQIY